MADLTYSAASTLYHAFINYCDSDNFGKALATELYNRLCKEELRVFPEVAEMPKQEKIPEIEEAIRTSSVHIAIFSPGYAGSRVCLMELVLMLKTGATIIPVFYGVKPSEVRSAEDNGLYAEGLDWMGTKESVNSELIKKWGKALSEVSDEKGFDLESHNSTDARQMEVNDILTEVVRKIGHVFINRCSDVQKTFASHLHRRLLFCGRRVFVGKEELRKEDEGDSLTRQVKDTKDAIEEASLHIAIFSKNYVESSCCLNELVSMVESKTTIIPVFYGVKPSDLRKTNKTNENWKTLDEVANIVGFEKKGYSDDDDGLLVNNIVERVLFKGEAISYDVFISHRGPDSKTTLASHLYRRLLAVGLRPFIDREDLEKGREITPQLNRVIKIASVNIAIFSKGYADSNWCMKELDMMVQSEAAIIPVYYGVKPSDLRETSKNSVYARALSNLERKRSIDPATNQPTQRYDSSAIKNWRQALSKVAGIRGVFDLKDHDGDEGLLLDKIVDKVDRIVRIKKDKQRSDSYCRRESS